MSELLDYWIFEPQVWLILGVALVILDIIVGLAMFVLPVGVAALILAALLWGQTNFWYESPVVMDDWHDVGLVFAGLALLSIWLIKRFFKRSVDDAPDINRY